MDDLMLPVLYEPSLIQKIFECCPSLLRLPDLLPTENVWITVAQRLARHHTPVTTVDELWYRVEVAWSSVPVHAIRFFFTQFLCV
ncbi:hypothetical protein TNCV_99061 [Trichonephila clavipes]|nr:hypothetical protein TNCV_99061 [Trichonephila clavipes]